MLTRKKDTCDKLSINYQINSHEESKNVVLFRKCYFFARCRIL